MSGEQARFGSLQPVSTSLYAAQVASSLLLGTSLEGEHSKLSLRNDLVQFRNESIMDRASNPALATMKFTISSSVSTKRELNLRKKHFQFSYS